MTADTDSERRHQDALLDEALDESFPASDPPASLQPEAPSSPVPFTTVCWACPDGHGAEKAAHQIRRNGPAKDGQSEGKKP